MKTFVTKRNNFKTKCFMGQQYNNLSSFTLPLRLSFLGAFFTFWFRQVLYDFSDVIESLTSLGLSSCFSVLRNNFNGFFKYFTSG